ncbi:Lrp/AsnC family transcriptional regulator [Rhizorhabdus sp.]|jgi:Lrp/AsnC family leucine-responsive transcriptional regulator|uniref:Lrp/AsnC family transcriptional regulator n=1 Tax=Rhizorhabdus sp. TaxID=1968843 RepID=UPI0025CB8F74|nr:Lrp/AsnC family transcriptional regulator [Rhizorhabdus sp.]
MSMPLDQIDHSLLAALEADARLSFASLGEAVGLSKTPCWKRVQGLEQTGAIRGYHAALDPAALGLGTAAFVRVSVRFDQHTAFERAVSDHPMIMACHATVGDTDYLAHILARDMTDLDEFLRSELWRLPGVERFTTTIAMREIKSAGSLAANAARKT